MAKHDETAADWTEVVLTRVSPKAKKALEERCGAKMLSLSAYVRLIVYTDLGLLPKDKD